MKTGPKPTPPLERFWPKVNKTETCWLWVGAPTNSSGYGRFWDGERPVLAHRFAYTVFRGPIPDGLHLDHLCRTPACVNPDHLEPVTNHTNVIVRGAGPAARASRTTRCPSGHPYDEVNTYRTSPTPKNPSGSRRCRACNAEKQRMYKARKHLRSCA